MGGNNHGILESSIQIIQILLEIELTQNRRNSNNILDVTINTSLNSLFCSINCDHNYILAHFNACLLHCSNRTQRHLIVVRIHNIEISTGRLDKVLHNFLGINAQPIRILRCNNFVLAVKILIKCF